MKNDPIPETANVLNADLVPPVKKWLAKHHPDAKFTDSNLDTLLCYATAPDDFWMPSKTDVEASHEKKRLHNLAYSLMLLPDAGLREVHQLMTKHPKATIAALAQFQHEDEKLLRNRLRRAVRRESCEGMRGNELAKHLVDDGQIEPSQQERARRYLNEMRREDLNKLSREQLERYKIKTP